MAETNVFGNAVTDDTVRSYNPYFTPPITGRDRAKMALICMTADKKATEVSSFVHKLKKEYGGDGTTTLCMIYNATGHDLRFVLNHTWEGSNFGLPYPQVIENGQWVGFLHVHDNNNQWGLSKEAIVYRGANNEGVSRDWMLAWDTTRLQIPNHVYTEIRPSGVFSAADWNTIGAAMEKQMSPTYSSAKLGCGSYVAIGTGSSPEFTGVMSLDLADNPYPMPTMPSDHDVVQGADKAAAAAAAK